MQPLQMDLSGKIALITGASGQLGRTMAKLMAQSGAKIALHYFQNQDQATQVQAEIIQLGGEAILVQANAHESSSVIHAVNFVLNTWGTIDILVLNAVSQYTWKPLLEQPPEDYLDQFHSTVMQAVHFCKAVAPTMVEKKQGRIIAINTECTQQCFPSQSAYVAGKRGLDGVMRVLARELGPSGITVNQVAPGWTESEKDQGVVTDSHRSYSQGVPLRRRGTDREVAQAVVFLASDLSSFTTGAILPVSGGNVMPTV